MIIMSKLFLKERTKTNKNLQMSIRYYMLIQLLSLPIEDVA